jgi:subtilisin
MKICTKCGAENPDSGELCERCGAPLTTNPKTNTALLGSMGGIRHKEAAAPNKDAAEPVLRKSKGLGEKKGLTGRMGSLRFGAEAPAPEKETPAEAPAPEKETPAEAPAPEKETPAEAPTPERETPAEAPAPEKEMPAEATAPEKETPAEAPAPERETPAEAPAPEKIPPRKGTGLAGSMGHVRYESEQRESAEKAPDKSREKTVTRKSTGLAGSMGGVRYESEQRGAAPKTPEKAPEKPGIKTDAGIAGSMGDTRYGTKPRAKDLVNPVPAPPQTPPPSEPEEGKGRRPDRWTLVALAVAALAAMAALLVIFRGALQSSTDAYGVGPGGFINYYQPVEDQLREEDGVRYAGDQLLIVSGMGYSREEMESFFQEKNMEVLGYVELIDTYQVGLDKEYSLTELHQLSRTLERDKHVDSATVNTVWELDSGIPQYTSLSGISGQPEDPWGRGAAWDRVVSGAPNWGVVAIGAPACWERYEPELIRVGVIDSMFDENNADLNFAVVKNNDVFSYYPYYFDAAYGHGTHVSGTIGAIHDNNRGLSGVAENCEIYAYSVWDLDTTLDVVSAFAELVAQDVHVINYSMGYIPEIWLEAMDDVQGFTCDLYYRESAEFCGIALTHLLKKGHDFVLVCAAGNNDWDANYGSVFTYITEPAVRARIVVVGAAGVNSRGEYYQADWSATGPRIDVLAPGVGVYSTLPGGDYDLWDGTSMAAPHVTGVCASVWAIAPKLTGAEVKSIVVETANIPVRGGDANMINMEAAMEEAAKR